MDIRSLLKLKEIYSNELKQFGLNEATSAEHGWHVDALFVNNKGGRFGLRLESGSEGDNPASHHIVTQVAGNLPLAGEITYDIWATHPQEGVNYLRSLFIQYIGQNEYKPLPVQAPAQVVPQVQNSWVPNEQKQELPPVETEEEKYSLDETKDIAPVPPIENLMNLKPVETKAKPLAPVKSLKPTIPSKGTRGPKPGVKSVAKQSGRPPKKV